MGQVREPKAAPSSSSPARMVTPRTQEAQAPGPLSADMGAARWSAGTLLRLQGGAGNAAVAQLVRSATSTSRLTIDGRRAQPPGRRPPSIGQRVQTRKSGRPAGWVSGTVQRLDEGAGGACPAPVVAPPRTTPEQDPAFKAMKAKAATGAKTMKAHPPASVEAAKAQKAAVPPANDTASQAKGAQVDEMAAAKPGTFDKAAFVAAVKRAIESKAPANLDEADNFAKSGQVDAVKAEVKGKVTEGKKATEAPMKAKTEEPPDPSKATPKSVTPMAPEPAPQAPPDPGAAAAMPKPAPATQTNLGADRCETEHQMAAEGVTEKQLAYSNEPAFQAAVDAKKEGEAHSAQAPQQFRNEEQSKLGEAKMGAAGTAQHALAGMASAKATSRTATGSAKTSAKAQDEADRQRVSTAVEEIYQRAKTETEGILKDLDGKVDAAFDTGEKKAREAFEASYKRDMDAFKDHRYSGPSGWVQWGVDKFKGPPAEVNQFLAKARAQYLQQMDQVVGSVADLIGAELGRARQRIAQGRDEVRTYVAGLKGNLARFGKDAEKNIDGRFAELEQSVDQKQEGLVDDLASKYTEARNGLDERIKEIQDENKGLWDKAKALVGDAIETIKKLKDMLLGVLSRAAGAVKKIIADPIGFLGKLVNAVRAGLDRFVGNIVGHLKKGLMGWLFGELANAGIELPDKFDLGGILKLVASILGLTWANFRNRLVKKVGEPIAQKLEQAVDFIKAIVVGGPAAAIKWIADKIGDIKDMVMDQIRSFVMTRVIMAGVQWLIGLLNPAAAFIKACKAIYDLIMWIVDNAGRIKEFVDTVLDSVEEILAGGVGKVAGMIEDALAKAVPMVIGVFASLLGLGGLSEKIKSILHAVQGPVNKAFDFLIGKAVKVGRRFLGALKRSKLGRAYGKGKELIKKGKAWAKTKYEAGKKWVKKKAAALKSKAAEALDLFKLGMSFSAGRGGTHRVFNSPAGSSDLMMASNESGPVVKKAKTLADPKAPTNTSILAQIEASYSRYRATANAAAARTRSRKGNYAARKRVLKGFLAEFTSLLRQLKLSGEKVGRPPGIWNVARHASQPSRMREHPIKVWHMESEHIVPRGMLSSAFKALAQAGIPGGGADYDDMTTLMVYKRVAEGKTRGDGGDWVEIALFKEAVSLAVGNFAYGRESDPDGAATRLSGVVLSRLDGVAAEAVSRTKEEMVMEHVANGDIRGKPGTTDIEPTPPEEKVDEAFKKQKNDINRQLTTRISRFLRNRSRRKGT